MTKYRSISSLPLAVFVKGYDPQTPTSTPPEVKVKEWLDTK